ncbi:MAG: ATP-binding protein, partial [Actinomycetota bacterium]|nr:ATP-binding protein [Actinomycetota bacterium]
AAGAILDRFLHHAEVISITGPSYRLHERKRKGLEIPEIKGEIINAYKVGRF